MILGKDSTCYTEDVGDYVMVGKYSSIAKGCRFFGEENHNFVKNKKAVPTGFFGGMYSRGPIKIGNDVWIGEGVVIMDGINIADGAIVGAYAVVTKDVPPYAVVAGNPARIVKFRFSQEIIDKLRQIKWWDWAELPDEAKKAFEDAEIFVEKYG